MNGAEPFPCRAFFIEMTTANPPRRMKKMMKTKMIAAVALLASVSSAYALEDYRPFAYLPTATTVAATDMVQVLATPSTDPVVKQITVANFSAYLGTLGGFINLDLGSSGVAGSLDIFPATATRGKVALTVSNQDANTTVTNNFLGMGQATALNVPDPGAATAYYVLSTQANDNTPVTATNTELNYTDVTTLGTVQASKAVTADGSSDTTGQRNITATGLVQAADVTSTDDTVVGDDLTVTGGAAVNESLTVTGAATVGGDVTVSSDPTGGNAGARSQVIGLPRIKSVGLSTMVNGATETTAYIDATPTGEWAEVDAGTNVAVTADTTYYRDVTNSVKVAFGATAVAGDGVDGTISQDDLSANESIGVWLYTDATTAVEAGDFALTIDDTDGTDQTYNLPALVSGVWTWAELNIAACDGNCDTSDGVKVLLTAQGAAKYGVATAEAVNLYVDAMYKWDADNEEALGVSIVQDGVLGVLTLVDANTGTHGQASLTEYTDYFIHYESGSDFIVTVSDQSTKSGTALIAY